METYNKMKDLILGINKDVEKIFSKKQDKAAIRVRWKMQELRKLAKDFRQEIQDSLINLEFEDDK